jgi:Na+-translocating ferredoxin:NAD+ oxidoreductase RnfG subunit
MSRHAFWLAPLALVLSAGVPADAVELVSLADAQKAAFPAATEFVSADIIFSDADKQAIEKLSGQAVRTGGEQVWKAQAGGALLGYFFLDYVIGKHLQIDYAVALSPDGHVIRVEILNYRESYGGEVARADWLGQFKGKTLGDPLQLNADILNISGATLSSRHIAEGVKRVLATFAVRLKGH